MTKDDSTTTTPKKPEPLRNAQGFVVNKKDTASSPKVSIPSVSSPSSGMSPTTSVPPPRNAGGLGQAVLMFIGIPALWSASSWIIIQVQRRRLIALYLLPYLKMELGVLPRDIPMLCVFAAAIHAFMVTPFVAAVMKGATRIGFDASAEGFALFGVAVLFAHQAGVPVSVRAHCAIFAIAGRYLHFFFYILDSDVLRTLSWMIFVLPCFALLAASSVPGVSKQLAALV
ncbi:hypothetical protein BC829DRAFT_415807 [Chytridium lagenaria]|nr:hypothetical protein BC829DRAFT_415807 [Chytridium lagenaria]